MKITSLELTEASAIRAREIEDAIEEHLASHPVTFGRDPFFSGARGIKLRQYYHDETLDALYAEYDALERVEIVEEVSDASWVEY